MGKKYSLAIIDPPYGSDNIVGGYTSGKGGKKGAAAQLNYNKSLWDCKAPEAAFFKNLFSISNDQVIWGANHFISKMPFDSSCWVVWDKKNENTGFADCELAWCSFKTAVRKFDFRWNGMLQEDMKNKETRAHPTQKPVALYKWLLKNYAKPGDTILDTHGGSMSIVIACIEMGFDIDIWEKDPDYFSAAKKRIENHVKQLPLFGPVPTINFFD